jgi:hypothetical protein
MYTLATLSLILTAIMIVAFITAKVIKLRLNRRQRRLIQIFEIPIPEPEKKTTNPR